jgi:hypothetical protein
MTDRARLVAHGMEGHASLLSPPSLVKPGMLVADDLHLDHGRLGPDGSARITHS